MEIALENIFQLMFELNECKSRARHSAGRIYFFLNEQLILYKKPRRLVKKCIIEITQRGRAHAGIAAIYFSNDNYWSWIFGTHKLSLKNTFHSEELNYTQRNNVCAMGRKTNS